MKHRFLKIVVRASLLVFIGASAHAGTSDLASAPLVTSSTSAVKPNVMFVLDDSGSMDWAYLPDWANSGNTALFRNSSYNGVWYNPAVTYSPPIYYNADGSVDTSTYPSMTSANTSNWASVKRDGYGVQSASTVTDNLVGNAYFYTFIAGEYCDKPNLRNCVTQSAPSSSHPYPATLRWCTNSAMTACQAVRIETGTTFMTARYPRPATATVALGIASSVQVSSITVDTGAGPKEILSATTSSSSTRDTVGGYLEANINACTAAVSGNCTVAGYSASYSGGNDTLTITAPAGLGAITATPVITLLSGGSMSTTASAFSSIPGSNLRTDIVSGTDSYPYPGTTAKASTRTDCAGSTCTYAEEMTNYANWWAYYHTRMQMMKTSTSLAFQTVGSNYRVGYATINGNQTNGFINLGTFDNTQKRAWFTKLFAANPSNFTPLRSTLSKIGRLYAGKLNGSSYDGVTVTDPMQYSCQQNFTILSTDGYWNDSFGYYKVDGSTDVGNQDRTEPRPFNDGGGTTVVQQTPTVSAVVATTPKTVIDRSTRTDTTPSTTTQTGTNTYNWTQRTSSRRDSCSGDTNTRQRTYTGTKSQTKTTITTSSRDYDVLTTTVYSDVVTTTTTSTRSVVTTNGVLTSDTTLTIPGSPTTVSTVTSGPTTVTTALGPATVTGTNSTFSPAPTSTNVTWTLLTDACITTTSDSDSFTLGSEGAQSPASPTPSVGSTTTGSPIHTPGYPQTSFGTTTTTTTGPTVGATTTTTTTSLGTSNTLADVAEYYYANELRTAALGNCTGAAIPPATTGIDVCSNDVPASGLDAASWQHMTSFTLGLGASGYMQFASNYTTASSGDYFDVKGGTPANPAGGVCSWQSSGACNWPEPSSGEQTTIDDLWHAAVNGRGTYFSATNPASLNAGLSSALSGVSARSGASAAATTSNPNVTSGDNFVFSSTFTTQQWDGELVRQQLDLVTGNILPSQSSTNCAADWCARDQLDANVSRTIYTFDAGAANKLKVFDWANLTTGVGGEQDYFLTPNISSLSQFCVTGITCLSAGDQDASHAAGQNLVNFLRGERTNEGVSTDITKYYRQRSHLLGDIVNAEAVYVKLPLFGYADAGYSDFITAQALRQGMVYVAANDGMLHAFNSTTGAETFSYIPSHVLPNLYKLADKNYPNLHRYFVDGTPVAGDVYFGGAWHTIVVGGLNGGGRGYYALDVTIPSAPVALWEFTDANMGYTYGNPTITKLADGTWVVLVTSGYNNVPDAAKATGDGVGRLYVINAATGALIREISTGAGSVGTPSGLARISAWVDNTTTDNTALRVYGGDMLGNLWRFDINGNIGAAGYDAQKLVTLYANGAGTVTQPITTRPELGDVSGVAVVYVGTGRYLGSTDLSDTTQQTFYAVKDTLGTAIMSNPRATGSTFVQQVLTSGTCPAGSPATICSLGQEVRTSTSNPVNFATDNGWYIDLPDSGERANTDPTLALGTLGFTTNVPNTSACTAGGYSYRYVVDYRTGAPVSTSTTGVSGVKLGSALATRGVFVRLPNNTVVQLTRLSDGTTLTTNVPIGSGVASTRRVSWRELIQDQ